MNERGPITAPGSEGEGISPSRFSAWKPRCRESQSIPHSLCSGLDRAFGLPATRQRIGRHDYQDPIPATRIVRRRPRYTARCRSLSIGQYPQRVAANGEPILRTLSAPTRCRSRNIARRATGSTASIRSCSRHWRRTVPTTRWEPHTEVVKVPVAAHETVPTTETVHVPVTTYRTVQAQVVHHQVVAPARPMAPWWQRPMAHPLVAWRRPCADDVGQLVVRRFVDYGQRLANSIEQVGSTP